jgi:hypothetical protein
MSNSLKYKFLNFFGLVRKPLILRVRYFTTEPKLGDSSSRIFKKRLFSDFEDAIKNNQKLLIDLDGTIGYGHNWLFAVFSQLVDKYGKKKVLSNIIIKSDEEPYLIDDILKIIK